MSKDVIPFVPASFGSFVGLVFTFGILGTVMALAGQMHWDRKIRGPRLEMLRFRGDSFLDQPTRQTPSNQHDVLLFNSVQRSTVHKLYGLRQLLGRISRRFETPVPPGKVRVRWTCVSDVPASLVSIFICAERFLDLWTGSLR